MKSQEVALSVIRVRARRKQRPCCLSQYGSLHGEVVPYRDAGRGSGPCRQWGLALREDWSLYPVCQGQSPWRLSLTCPVQATPQGVGNSRGNHAGHSLCLWSLFSIAGKVPQGSLSDLFALCYEIQWFWLHPRVWLGRAKCIVTSCFK